MDESGSITSVLEYPPTTLEVEKNMEFTKNGIKMLGSRSVIAFLQRDPKNEKYILIKTEDGKNLKVKMIDSVKKGDVLVISNVGKRQSDNFYNFLISKNNKDSWSLKSVHLFEDELSRGEEKEIFIDLVNQRVIQSKTRLTEEVEEQIEALLKMQKQLIKSKSENIPFIKEQLEKIEHETEKYLNREEIEYLYQNEIDRSRQQTQIEMPPKN